MHIPSTYTVHICRQHQRTITKSKSSKIHIILKMSNVIVFNSSKSWIKSYYECVQFVCTSLKYFELFLYKIYYMYIVYIPCHRKQNNLQLIVDVFLLTSDSRKDYMTSCWLLPCNFIHFESGSALRSSTNKLII